MVRSNKGGVDQNLTELAWELHICNLVNTYLLCKEINGYKNWKEWWKNEWIPRKQWEKKYGSDWRALARRYLKGEL